MKITRLDSVEKINVTMDGARGAVKQIPVGKSDGAPLFSFRVFTLDPHGHTPYHRHPYEHVNYIIDGAGVVVNECGERFPVKKGDFALVLPDEMHQYRNTSENEPLVIICAVPAAYE